MCIRDRSNTFNRMTEELYQTVNNLEIRVSERTTDLESARQQSEKRANELQSIGEISKIITSEQKLTTLLPLITRLVSESFGFYHTGIFLVNETKQFAVLQAANSEGGKIMLARGHKLEVGAMCIRDRDNGGSNLTIPIRLRGKTIGIINLRTAQQKLTSDDADIAESVTERLSLAIETALLIQTTQHRADVERITSDISSRINSSTRFETILQTAAQELSRALGGSDVLVQLSLIHI